MAFCPQCARENPDSARFCDRCGTMLDAPASGGDPLVGRVVADRYRVVRLIGEGGMGRVYLAEQRMGTATRRVAFKVLTTSMADPGRVARFYRECETVVQLEHPNTIRFYDFGQLALDVDGRREERLYIVMEYVDGPSLADMIAAGPLPLETVDRLVHQIGGALGEAHRHGIIHRDLKPDNVLVAHDLVDGEVAKVLDFGLAKQSTATDAGLTTPGTILGTPAYMSPEQFIGGSIDERSDVYALALLIYEMLTGKRPFEAHTPLEWATAHTSREPRPFDAFEATRTLAPERRAAILRGLAKKPAERTGSVVTLVDEFCRNGGASHTRSPVDREEPTPATPSWSVLRWLVAAVVLVVVVGGLGAWRLFGAGAADPPAPSDPGDAGRRVQHREDAGERASPSEPPGEWMTLVHYERRVEARELALGAPDERCAEVGPRGMITFVLPPGRTLYTDGTDGAELRVVVDEDRSGPYRLQVGMHHDVYATVAEAMIGSALVDVDPADVDRFRAVRIQNRATGGVVCVDAVAVLSPE